MNSTFVRLICRFLIASMLFLPFQGAQAGMIGAGQAAATQDAGSDRAMLRNLMTRSDVASQLHSMGVDQSSALERVAAMTDGEVRTLANNIQSLPAGARSDGWTLVVLILIGVAIYYVFK